MSAFEGWNGHAAIAGALRVLDPDRTLRPSTKPACANPARKESELKRYVAGEELLRKPTSGKFALASRDHIDVAAMLTMKSRRLIAASPKPNAML